MSHEDDHSYDNNYNYDNDSHHQKKHAMPVKPHIKQIEDYIADVRKDCDENKKNAGLIKGELAKLSTTTKDRCNSLTRLIMEDLHNLEKEFKRTVQSDKTEVDFFKQQLNGLTQDKTKIKQSAIGLDTRLKQCETDVGMGFSG